MSNREQPRRDRPARAALAGALQGTCALAAFWLAAPAAAVAQSPFTQPPSRSGTFTLPSSPSPASPFTQPMPSPGRTSPLSPLRPPRAGTIPGQSPRRLPGMEGLPPYTETLPTLPEVGLPLPLPAPEEGLSGKPGELPPKPAVMPPLNAAPTGPVPHAPPLVLKAGLHVTLRVSQVIPADGFSPGERLLNSRQPIQAGDCFLAEIIDPCPLYPILVGGTVTKITDPGHFGKPGYVSLQMTQLVQAAEGRGGVIPWRMDMADRRFATRMRRVLLSTLLGLEGAGTGASIGAQFSGGNMAYIGGGMGIGAIVGLGYASFQRGTEANLEPGDTFEIVVGTTEYRPVSREWQTILYPAGPTIGGKAKKP